MSAANLTDPERDGLAPEVPGGVITLHLGPRDRPETGGCTSHQHECAGDESSVGELEHSTPRLPGQPGSGRDQTELLGALSDLVGIGLICAAPQTEQQTLGPAQPNVPEPSSTTLIRAFEAMKQAGWL